MGGKYRVPFLENIYVTKMKDNDGQHHEIKFSKHSVFS